jgi:hypothetical protein
MNGSPKSVGVAARMLLLAFVVGGIGCKSFGGPTVVVEFLSADGVDTNEAVYFAGVRVGETGDATVVGGRARVPIYLARRQRRAIPNGAVFVIGDDPNISGRHALLGYAVTTTQARIEDGIPVYRGLSCELELAVLLGAEKAKELMDAMKHQSDAPSGAPPRR